MIADLFKRIDGFIFEQMLKLKTTPAMSKVQEAFNELDEHVQRVVKYVLVCGSILLPFCVSVWFLASNYSINNDLTQMKESLERIKHFNSSKAMINRSGINLLAPTPINNQSDFTNRISMAATSSGIDLKNVQTNDYSSEALPGEIQKSVINIKFNDLGTDQLFNMLLSLSEAHYIKYDSIEINRNKEKSLLEGIITLNHFSKIQNSEN